MSTKYNIFVIIIVKYIHYKLTKCPVYIYTDMTGKHKKRTYGLGDEALSLITFTKSDATGLRLFTLSVILSVA